MPLPRRHWFEMSTRDFQDGDTSSWIAVLPIAAIEQHGPHLPVGVDSMIMQGYLDRAIPALPPHLPVTFLPIQCIGKSNEHLAFPGTITLSAETALRAWIDIGESIRRAGVRKLLIVNSHGGNMALMDIVTRELRVRHGMLAAFTSWHMFGYPEGLFSADETRLGIHGGEIETALMLDFRPELVRMDRAEDFRPVTYEMEKTFTHLRTGRPAGFGWMAQDIHPAGVAGDASRATGEHGRASAAFGATALIELLEDLHRFDLTRLKAGPQEVTNPDERSNVKMNEDPLYIKITNEFLHGSPPISHEDAVKQWHYSDSHTRNVLNWMSDQQHPPTLKKLSSPSPTRWERMR